MNGYICQGFNPLLSFPNRAKITRSLAKLKFLVTMDPLDTDATAGQHGSTVVTRNFGDFKPFGVPVLDPFKSSPAGTRT